MDCETLSKMFPSCIQLVIVFVKWIMPRKKALILDKILFVWYKI